MNNRLIFFTNHQLMLSIMAIILLFSSCTITESYWQYDLKLDGSILHGKIYYSTDKNYWKEILPSENILVDANSLLYFKAIPENEYIFNGWNTNNIDILFGNDTITQGIHINKNITLLPLFINPTTVSTYTLKAGELKNGKIQYSLDGLQWIDLDMIGIVKPKGTQIMISAIPDNGYFWASWGGITNSQNNTSIILNQDVVVQPIFTPFYSVSIATITGQGTLQYNLDNSSTWYNFPATNLLPNTKVYIKATPTCILPTSTSANDGIYAKYGSTTPMLTLVMNSIDPTPLSVATSYVGSIDVNNDITMLATFIPEYNLHLINPNATDVQNYITYSAISDATAYSKKLLTDQLIVEGDIYMYINKNPAYNYTITSNNNSFTTYKTDTAYRKIVIDKNTNISIVFTRIPQPTDISGHNISTSTVYGSESSGSFTNINSLSFQIGNDATLSYILFYSNGTDYWTTSTTPFVLQDATTLTYAAYNVSSNFTALNVYVKLGSGGRTIKIEDSNNPNNYTIFYFQ